MFLWLGVAIGGLLLFLLGAWLSAAGTRRQLSSSPEAFRCKIRSEGENVPGLKPRWPRRAGRAVWLHDSLVVVTGTFRAKVHRIPVRFAERAVDTAPDGTVAGLGPHAVTVSIQLDDGSSAVLAAPATARSVIAGPYLVAQLSAGSGATTDGRQGLS